MPLPIRSIRLEKRTSRSLDTLSGESGEIFFDAGQNTLRIYTANQSDSIVMADRAWVTANTFSGNYNDLTNKPTVPTDINQLSDATNLLFSGDYNDLINAPDLDGLSIDISTINSIGDVDTETNPLVAGQLLEWDGTNWVNTTVAGFVNTDTTYSIAASIGDSGANITLTDSEGDTSQVEIVGGTNVTVGVNLTGDIEVSTSLPSLSQLSDTVITTPQDGQLLGYNSGQWINVAAPVAQSGIELTDLSATNGSASGAGSLAYDNTLGVFTFTPPDLSTYANLNSFSVTTSAASAGGSLSYSNGTFTFRPALVSDFIALTDISVVSNAASGGGALSYSNSTGQFTYTPPDLSGVGGGEVVDDTTPTLGGTLDAATNDITNVGTITATTYANAGTGAPSITSASTITLDAPDGIILDAANGGNIVIDTILDGADNGGNRNGEWKVKFSGPYGNSFGELFEFDSGQFGSTLTFDLSGNLTTNGAVINYTDDLIIKAPTMTFDTGLVGYKVGQATATATEITIDTSNTQTAYDFATSGNRTIAFTNVPTTTDKIYTFNLYALSGLNINAVTVNGNSETLNSLAPVGTGTGQKVFKFQLLYAGGSLVQVFMETNQYA
jgi:hypothetical protein